MLKYTYHLEYYIGSAPHNKHEGFYSCNELLEIFLTILKIHT